MPFSETTCTFNEHPDREKLLCALLKEKKTHQFKKKNPKHTPKNKQTNEKPNKTKPKKKFQRKSHHQNSLLPKNKTILLAVLLYQSSKTHAFFSREDYTR